MVQWAILVWWCGEKVQTFKVQKSKCFILKLLEVQMKHWTLEKYLFVQLFAAFSTYSQQDCNTASTRNLCSGVCFRIEERQVETTAAWKGAIYWWIHKFLQYWKTYFQFSAIQLVTKLFWFIFNKCSTFHPFIVDVYFKLCGIILLSFLW